MIFYEINYTTDGRRNIVFIFIKMLKIIGKKKFHNFSSQFDVTKLQTI